MERGNVYNVERTVDGIEIHRNNPRGTFYPSSLYFDGNFYDFIQIILKNTNVGKYSATSNNCGHWVDKVIPQLGNSDCFYENTNGLTLPILSLYKNGFCWLVGKQKSCYDVYKNN